jgi:hypothetical protein
LMNFETFLSSENPSEHVDEILDKHFESTNEEKFSDFINKIGSSKLQYDVLVKVLSGSIKRIDEKIENPSIQLSCLESIQKLLEFKNVKDIEEQLLGQVAKTYEALGDYKEAATVLMQKQGPKHEFDEEGHLEYYGHVGELWLKAGEQRQLEKIVGYLNDYIFRERTPRKYQDIFDILHGYSAVYSLNFQDAIRAFNTVVNNSDDKANRSRALKLAAVCVCLNTKSRNNNDLKTFAQDDDVKQYDFYNLIDLMAREQFIDQAVRDDFLSKTKDYFGIDLSESLDKSSLQHNLKVAEKFFSTVKIGRLAQLIGSTPTDVEIQMKSMIVKGQIKASIDQPSRMVVFESEFSQDESILEYSQAVNALANEIYQ